MDRIKRYSVHSSLLAAPDYGKGDTCPIDQQPAKDFNVDPATGHPMSDITAVMKSQSLSAVRDALDIIETSKHDFLDDSVSDADALKYSIPRLCQLPSELAEYTESVTKARLQEKAVKQRDEQLKKEQEEYENYLSELKKKSESKSD